MTTANRPRPRAYFYRNGVELTAHPGPGKPVLSFGVPTGAIGKFNCFSSVTVRTTIEQELAECDFSGPVAVKVWSPESKAIWFGIASVETVESTNKSRRELTSR